MPHTKRQHIVPPNSKMNKLSHVTRWLLYFYSLSITTTLAQVSVECEASRIVVTVVANRPTPFNGKIFIKGASTDSDCVTDFGDSGGATGRAGDGGNRTSTMRVAIDYNMCNTERIRQVQPAGIVYANTIIVQHHRVFITAGDEAYHIRCFYSQSTSTVTAVLDVGQLPTQPLTDSMAMPRCGYTVRRASVNGALVRSASVGDVVFHRWQCDGNGEPYIVQAGEPCHVDAYRMFVHSCFVEDDKGAKTQIMDDNGCSLDHLLLPSISYNNKGTLAYSQANVFKFPDNSYVHFKCQIRLCTESESLRASNMCIPVDCGDLDRARESNMLRRSRRLAVHDYEEGDDRVVDVVASEILVLDENSPYTANQRFELLSTVEERLAVNYSTTTLRRTIHDPLTDLLCENRLIVLTLFTTSMVFFMASIIFLAYIVRQLSTTRATVGGKDA